MRKTAVVLAMLCICQSALADGIIKITSQPTGATINIGNEKKGKTPCALRLLAGLHMVIATKKKYDPYVKTVEIKESSLTELKIVLQPSPIKIKIKSNVKDARVFVDGTEVGVTNEIIMGRPGKRELIVAAEGYRDSVSRISIPWKGPRTYTVNLTKGSSFRLGTLAINEDNWEIVSGWVFTGGVATFDKGSKACMKSKRTIVWPGCFALAYKFRAQNLEMFFPWLNGGINSMPRHVNDGRWHTILIEVSNRKARCAVDGSTMSRFNGGPLIDGPFSVEFSHMPRKNNDPFCLEIASIVLKEFESAQHMAVALKTSVLK